MKIRVTDLFLVGDIFDLWIADRRRFVREYKAVAEKIQLLRLGGMRVHYFEGNHDLDLRLFWQHQIGVDVHSEAAFFELNGVKLRVEHGDQMDPDDSGYLFLRWFLRTPLMVFLGRYLPNFVVDWIGQQASEKSRTYTTEVKSASDDQVREKIKAHALRAYTENEFDVLISGHVHVAVDMRFDAFRCLNMGTWLKEPMVVWMDGAKVELIRVSEFMSR